MRKLNADKKNKEKKSLITIEKNSYNYDSNIDYEKLAEAIVDAQQKAMQSESATSNLFATIISLVFKVISTVGMVFASALVIIGGYEIFFKNNTNSLVECILVFLMVFLLSLLLFLLALALWHSAKELESEKDRQFVVAVFSAFASFCAMIVALIALFKS